MGKERGDVNRSERDLTKGEEMQTNCQREREREVED